MPDVDALPELKQIMGALIFGANRPLSIRELRDCLVEVAETDKAVEVYAEVDNKQVREAIAELASDLERCHAGFTVQEGAGGYRLQRNRSGCRARLWRRWRSLRIGSRSQRVKSRPCEGSALRTS